MDNINRVTNDAIDDVLEELDNVKSDIEAVRDRDELPLDFSGEKDKLTEIISKLEDIE